MLNIAEDEAKQRKFCTVRVDLDESHAGSELKFFAKFFNAILCAAISEGAYEGRDGKTFQTYVDMITTYKVPENKTFCPFLFPIQYAKAKMAGNESIDILDDNIKNDMHEIYSQLEKPIIILMDECDVLTENRPLLQKIRNIFMHMKDYMIILAATPRLFPLLDDVFSPIIRQLKRINIQEFKDQNDSETCMNNPLHDIDIAPDQVFSRETYKEIHDLSGGNPYEINLICHVLFRSFQKSPRKHIRLSASLLEDIRNELEKSKNLHHGEVLQRIKGLSKSELQGLNVLCGVDNRLTLEQIICLERIFYREKRYKYHEIKQLYSNLKSKGIIGLNDSNCLVFLGDAFDRIYAKYFAQEQKIMLRINQISPSFHWVQNEWILFLRNKIEPEILFRSEGPAPDKNDIDQVFKSLISYSSNNVFEEYGRLARDIYWLLVQDEQIDDIYILHINTNLDWISNISWFYFRGPIIESLRSKIIKICDQLKSTVQSEGGQLKYAFDKIKIPSYDNIFFAIENTREDKIKSSIAYKHLYRAFNCHIQDRNSTAALWHASIAERLSHTVKFKSNDLNNLGYIFLKNNEIDLAVNLLELSLHRFDENSNVDKLLILYNLALAYWVAGNIDNSRKILANIDPELYNDDSLACLLFPELQKDGSISLSEQFNPDFHEVVSKALTTLGIG